MAKNISKCTFFVGIAALTYKFAITGTYAQVLHSAYFFELLVRLTRYFEFIFVLYSPITLIRSFYKR